MTRARVGREVFAALSVALAILWSGAATAQTGNVANGKSTYTNWCVACHNANPLVDAHGIINGANDPNFILSIWRSDPNMQFLLQGALPDPVQAAADVAAYLGSLLGGGSPTQTAVEYYYAAWNYYFVTSFPDEIAGLDGGAYGGVWQRTGETFNVWTQPVGGALPTCRFFSTSFAPKSSHFYTPNAAECAGVMNNPNWQFESIAFYLQLPDVNGNCPAGTGILYRLYNNGMGGAPNHRFTTSPATLSQMLAAGWIFEGDLRTFAFACVPLPGGTAEGARLPRADEVNQ